MHIRVTTDPISLNEIADTTGHPCHYEGDGDNGLEIYFDNESNLNEFLEWERNEDHKISVQNNTVDVYIAEG